MLLHRLHIYLLLTFLLSVSRLYGNDTIKVTRQKWIPDFCTVQFAGNLGMVSLGAGYGFFNDRLHSSVFFSYIPKDYSGVNIYTTAIKNSFFIHNFRLKSGIKISPYCGGAISYSGHLPPRYLPHAGIRLFRKTHRRINGFDIYFEAGSEAEYLKICFNNRTVPLKSVINNALGVTLYF